MSMATNYRGPVGEKCSPGGFCLNLVPMHGHGLHFGGIVDIYNHMWSVVFSSERVIHPSFTGLSC